MTVASALLQRHNETLLSPGEWETLIADDILWELPFAPALGHPGRLEGREAVETHVKWFRGAVENFPVLGHSCLSARRPRWRGGGGQSRRAVVPENSIRADSLVEAESEHHPGRCLHAFSCLGCLSPTCSGRGASLKSRTSFFAISSILL